MSITSEATDSKLNEFVSKYLHAQFLAVTIGIWSIYLIPQILSVKITEKMSFYSNDGHCIEAMPLFGDHCFGDFGYQVEMVRAGKESWGPPFFNNYPPLNSIIFLVFSFLVVHFGATIVVLLYSLVSVICIAFPVWDASRKFNIRNRLLLLFVGVFATLPILNVIDRGNNVVWLVPVLYFISKYLIAGHKFMTIFLFVLAISLRPQAAILLIILLTLRKYLEAIGIIFLSLLINFILFVIWDYKTVFKNISNMISSTISYGSGIPGEWPPNISMGRGILNISNIFHLNLSSNVIQLTVYIICSGVVIKMFLNNELELNQKFQILIPLMFLVTAMTWWYYLVLLYPMLSIHVYSKSTLVTVGLGNKKIGLFYLLVFCASMVPIYFPVTSNHINLIQFLTPSLWFVQYLLYLFFPWNRNSLSAEVRSGK